LLRLLDGLAELHVSLEWNIRSKLDAIRAADMNAVQSAMQEEQQVTDRLREREGLRKQLMDAVGAELGLARGAGRKLTVSELAARLPESSRLTLWQSAGSLRKAMAATAQANRVAGSAVRTLLHHMQWVFASIRPTGAAPLTYSKHGRMVPQGGTVALETVG